MLKLYHAPKTRSVRVMWLLEELGLDYAVHKLAFSPAALKSEEYLKINPMGRVPAIEDGDVCMFESGAILQYILENYGEGRLEPKVGTPERALFLQWMHFAEGQAMSPFSDIFQHSMILPADQRVPEIAKKGREKAAEALGVLEKGLEGKTWLCGEEFTAADIMVGYVVFSAKMLGLINDELPNLKAYWGRIKDRPAFQKAAA